MPHSRGPRGSALLGSSTLAVHMLQPGKRALVEAEGAERVPVLGGGGELCKVLCSLKRDVGSIRDTGLNTDPPRFLRD
jgi:hypothetical protein